MRVRAFPPKNPHLPHLSNCELLLFFLGGGTGLLYMDVDGMVWYGMVCCVWAELGYRS